MQIVGTHDELTYLRMQCVQRKSCDDCVLEIWCTHTRPDSPHHGRIKKSVLQFQEVQYSPGTQVAWIRKET